MTCPRFLYCSLSLLLGSGWLSCRAADLLQKQPFERPSERTGTTLFQKLEASATGLVVDNRYDDPEMWGSRYRAFMGGAMGSGVAAGDFDQDGNVDLYVSTKTRPGRLFRNLGGWRFEDVTDKAGLAEEGSLFARLKGAVSKDTAVWRQGAVFADVNNDGHPDLYVCRNGAPNLLYVNRGDGTFVEEAEKRGLGLSDGSVVGAFADYDRDGWLDVLVLTNQVDGSEPNGRPERLFRNSGKGFYTETTQTSGISGGTFGHAATWIDYDEDGWPDVYICNDFAGPDRLYRNNGDGTFDNVLDRTVPHTPYSSMGADVADVDNDGHFDLFVADMATTTREKDRRGLAASRDDVLMAGTQSGTAPQYMRNALLLNTGLGKFQEGACLAGIHATDWTWSVRLEDFDNDGWADLHVTNGMVREANNGDLLARMMRALSDAERIGVIKKSPLLAEANLAYRNDGGLRFENTTASWGLGEVGVSFGAATADLDRDGDLDLVYLNYDGGLSVYRNDTVGKHRLQVRLRGTKSNRQGVGAIVRIHTAGGTQVRTFTVARGYASGSDLVAHFGLDSARAVERLVVEWPSGLRQQFDQLEADHAYTLTEGGPNATAEARPAPVFVLQTQPAGLSHVDKSALTIPDKEQIFIPYRTDRRGPFVASGDIDGDGYIDLLIGATTGTPARVFRGSGKQFTDAPHLVPPADGVEDGPVLLADFDGNGTPDLLVTKASANTAAWPGGFKPIVYQNQAGRSFVATDLLPPLTQNTGAVCAADIDGDGDLDLFLGARSVPGRYPVVPDSVLLRNENGHFVEIAEAQPQLRNVGLVTGAVFADVDTDGRPDLVVALEWNHVRCFHNDGGGRFSDWTEKVGFSSGGRGWWSGLVSADFNGDGRPDFAAGNAGLNTTYQVSPEKPAVLLYGDFAQNRTKLLLEAMEEGGQLFPVRARSDLAARLPYVLRKYPKNDDFARAPLADIVGKAALESADVLKADNLVSGVFLSQADGSYRFAAFPREAQFAPVQGLVALDFDGDGAMDLCATQNTDSALPRFHGGAGALLKGDGRGGFHVLRPDQSGLLLTGNGRAVVVLDPEKDGAPDLFITQHGGPAELYANRRR